MRRLAILFVSLFLSSVTLAADFGEAVAAYDAGNYPAAIAGFSELLASRGRSAELHFDLGDSYFRNKDLGHAIFEFRKAHELAPRDPDIRYNLDYARKRVTDRIEERGVGTVLDNLPWTTREAWVALAFASAVFWGFGLARLFKREPRLAWGQYAGAAMLCLALLGAALRHFSTRPFGVVTVSEAEVYSGVGKDNVLLFKLHEGDEFWTGAREGEWVQIVLPDGKKGWLRGKDVVI